MSDTTSPLRDIGPGIWESERHMNRSGMHLRVRMVVVRLPSGGLWLHSPFAPDDEICASLDALGPVEILVAPNKFHHLFLGDMHARYPASTMWGAPGLAAKRKDLAFTGELSQRPLPWDEVLDSVLLEGVPFNQESVFYHRASKSLICTDFIIHVPEEPSWLTRQVWRLMGVWNNPGMNRVWRWKMRDKAAFNVSVDRVLEWDFTQIVMSHGEILQADATWLRDMLAR